ncbi:MAG: LuxR family transcriptional regulator [Planctomycetes bacterium]|nr:LuxR family transcriptional regulator [Planctomycetota bacterium]
MLRGSDQALGKHYSDRRLFWGRFNAEDLKQFQAIVGMLDLLMMRISSRPLKPVQDATHSHPVVPRCNYHVAFAIIPTHEEFSSLARIQAECVANTPYEERHVAAAAFGRLTPRERQVFDLLLTGRSLAQIGKALGISRATVATLARHCYRKFRVRGRQQLAAATLGMSP